MANTSGSQRNRKIKMKCSDKDLIVQLLESDNYQIGKSTYVKVIHIVDPHDFFVQPTKYRPILNHAEQQQKRSKRHVSEPELGTLYLFDSKNAQKWIRGRILCVEMKSEEMNCTIEAIDYGFIETKVPFRLIKPLVCCQSLPPLCIHCRLDNCEPNNKQGWDKDGIEGFKYYTNQPLKMTVTGVFNDKLSVELYNGDDVSTLMAYSERAVFGFMLNDINRLSCSVKAVTYCYPFRNIIPGDLLHVRVLSGKTASEFYVAEMNDYKDYVDFVCDLSYFCKNEPYVEEHDLITGRPVVIFNNNNYQRAQIMDDCVSDDKIMVQLVDVGTKVEVSVCRIKRIPDRFLKIPVVAIPCAQQENGNDNLKKLIWAGERFDVVIEEVGYRLEKPHLVNIKLSSLTIQSI